MNELTFLYRYPLPSDPCEDFLSGNICHGVTEDRTVFQIKSSVLYQESDKWRYLFLDCCKLNSRQRHIHFVSSMQDIVPGTCWSLLG